MEFTSVDCLDKNTESAIMNWVTQFNDIVIHVRPWNHGIMLGASICSKLLLKARHAAYNFNGSSWWINRMPEIACDSQLMSYLRQKISHSVLRWIFKARKILELCLENLISNIKWNSSLSRAIRHSMEVRELKFCNVSWNFSYVQVGWFSLNQNKKLLFFSSLELRGND